jgi:hypothetical protein
MRNDPHVIKKQVLKHVIPRVRQHRPPIDGCGIRTGSNPGTPPDMIVVVVELLHCCEMCPSRVPHRIKGTM